jgi:hypothetical protein
MHNYFQNMQVLDFMLLAGTLEVLETVQTARAG